MPGLPPHAQVSLMWVTPWLTWCGRQGSGFYIVSTHWLRIHLKKHILNVHSGYTYLFLFWFTETLYLYTHMDIYTHTHIHIHTYTHTHMHIHIHIQIQIHMHINVHTDTDTAYSSSSLRLYPHTLMCIMHMDLYTYHIHIHSWKLHFLFLSQTSFRLGQLQWFCVCFVSSLRWSRSNKPPKRVQIPMIVPCLSWSLAFLFIAVK